MGAMFFGHNKSISAGVANYGLLYNSLAADDVNFPPANFRRATQSDLDSLVDTIGGVPADPDERSAEENATAGAMKTSGLDFWSAPNTEASNSFGFNLKGAGFGFSSFKYYAAIALGGQSIFEVCTEYNFGTLGHSYTLSENTGKSVRMVWEGAGTAPSTVTDYDGNVYDIIEVGGAYWTVQNWKCRHFNNGTVIPAYTDETTWDALTTLGCCYPDNNINNV